MRWGQARAPESVTWPAPWQIAVCGPQGQLAHPAWAPRPCWASRLPGGKAWQKCQAAGPPQPWGRRS